ncbi:MAG TPA: hypothetical protein VEJ63_07780 [Planctomycetota bacterium]|nr:hypothetical protein [Planctomycetota bacterium]
MRRIRLALVRILAAVTMMNAAAFSAESPKVQKPDERYFGTDSFVPDWKKAEEIDARASEFFLKNHWPKFKADYDKGGSAALSDASAQQKAAGAVVFLHSMIEPLGVDALPKAERVNFERTAIFAARGESEPVLVGVRTLGEPREISIEVSDLAGPAGKIAKENITNRLLLPYKISKGKGVDAVEQMVLLKTPQNRWTFPPNYAMAYAVDVHVPVDAPPGKYSGRIVVKSGRVVAKEFTLELEVLPFTLKTNNFHAGGFGVSFKTWAGGFTAYHPEMMEMDARYGFNMAGGFFNKGAEIPFRKDAQGNLEVNPDDPKFQKFNETMKNMAKHNLGQVAFWNWGASGDVKQFNNVLKAAGYGPIHTEEGKKGFGEICRAIKAAEKKHGWPEVVINPYDEALMDQDSVREIIAGVHYVHEMSPETRLYMTQWREGYARLYQSQGKQLQGKSRPQGKELQALKASNEAPQLNFHVIGNNVLENDARKMQDELGGEYWHYTVIGAMDAQARFAYGFKAWIARCEACLIWATYKGDLDGSGWTLHYAMPEDPAQGEKNTRGPVIASVRAIPAREGIDDRKYIETLKFHARKMKSEDDLKFLNELAERCRGLADLKNIGGVDNTEATGINGNAFHSLRVEIKNRILKLVANGK